ncbi:MAG: response regulator [Pyrinomonadaceae bacterium]
MPPDSRRVLCAEPHQDVCAFITLLLEQQGHQVLSAKTIKECIELAAESSFDLYMLDDNYIDGSGLELCRDLRRLTPETPILFFSAQAFDRDRQRGLDAGAQGYLTKPADIFEIVQAVNSILIPRGKDSAPR